LAEHQGKRDPRQDKITQQPDLVTATIWAASKGDVGALQHLLARGAAVNDADYDGRTPLHLAAAEGHISMAKLLVRFCASVNSVDRWGCTPIEDAKKAGHQEVAAYLRDCVRDCVKN
jgi:glutaminase